MNCPDCNVQLLKSEGKESGIEYCPKCNKEWLEGEALKKSNNKSYRAKGTSYRIRDDDLFDDFTNNIHPKKQYNIVNQLNGNIKTTWTDLFDL